MTSIKGCEIKGYEMKIPDGHGALDGHHFVIVFPPTQDWLNIRRQAPDGRAPISGPGF